MGKLIGMYYIKIYFQSKKKKSFQTCLQEEFSQQRVLSPQMPLVYAKSGQSVYLIQGPKYHKILVIDY